MKEEATNLFPEKDLFEMKFLNFIKFDKSDVANKSDIDKAIQEYFFLKTKTRELDKYVDRQTSDILSKAARLRDSIDYTRDIIINKIEDYYSKNSGDLTFKDDGDGNMKATLEFEHGEITIIRKTKTEFKFKPTKTDAKA